MLRVILIWCITKKSQNGDYKIAKASESQKEYFKKYYAVNRDKILKQKRDHYKANGSQKTYRAYNREQRVKYSRTYRKKHPNFVYITEYLLTHPCISCGESDPIVLDFDHTDKQNKNECVSVMGIKSSLEEVKKEIEKCVVLCSNCHRRRTAKQFNWVLLEYLEEKNKGTIQF